MDTLTEVIEAEQGPSGELLSPTFRLEDPGTADWALRRLAECNEELAEIGRQYEAAVAMLAARREKVEKRLTHGVAYFTGLLTDYADRKRGELLKGTRKTATFLHGEIRFRKKSERLVTNDKDALSSWLASQPVESGLYRVKIEPEVKALQDLFRTSGQVPPGMDVEPESESLTIEALAPERALKEKP